MRRFVELSGPRGVTWDGDPTSLLDRLHLLREGQPTIGAVLLFGADPQRVLPQAMVRLRTARGAVEEGTTISGGVLRQIEDTVRQVQLRLRHHIDRAGLIRRDITELPAVAIREAIVNAIAHRDYRSTAPTQVRLDEEKLEIWNPGHLPEPLTVATLRRTHPSVPPNPRIARALYLAGFVEEWGSGTLRMIASMEEQGNAAPLFEASLGGISVTLPLLGAERALLSERQADVIERLRDTDGPARVVDLAKAL